MYRKCLTKHFLHGIINIENEREVITMNKVVYVTRDNKETANYKEAKAVGINEVKYVPMVDEVADKANEKLINFWRKTGGYALKP